MRFLLIRNDVLGDAVVSSVFIEALSKSISCQIDVMCNAYNAIAFKHNPHVSNIFISAHQQGTKALASDYCSVINNINATGEYAAVFVLNPCLRSTKYASLVNSKLVVARAFKTKSFKTKIWFLFRKLSHRYLFIESDPSLHEAQVLYSLLQAGFSRLGLDQGCELPLYSKFYLPDTALVPTDSKVRQNSCLINISGKQKPIKYLNDSLVFSLLANLLISKRFERIAIISTCQDLPRIKRLLARFQATCSVPIICSDDIIEIAEHIAQYGFFISGDGGLTHIAAGLGLKCVTLFDEQPSTNWHPWTPLQISLQTESHHIYDISYVAILAAISQLQSW